MQTGMQKRLASGFAASLDVEGFIGLRCAYSSKRQGSDIGYKPFVSQTNKLCISNIAAPWSLVLSYPNLNTATD
jgi:hypothetical protein